MKTSRLFLRFFTMLLACMAFSLTGCIPQEKPEANNGNNNDPGGDNGDEADKITVYEFILYADDPGNISGIRYNSNGRLFSDDNSWSFCNVGMVSGIEKLTTIPWSPWFESAFASPRDGIVAYHPAVGYMTILILSEVVDQFNHVVGICLIYRPFFTGINEPIQLQTTNIVAPAEGLHIEIPVTSKSYTPFEVASLNEDWCHAAPVYANGMFMPSRISVSIDANDSYDSRDAIVVVGSVYGKNTSVTVTQSGLSTGDDDE